MLNKRFGRLVVTAAAPRRPATRHRFWRCQCDCGATSVADGSNLKNGHTRYCGCLMRDTSALVNFIHAKTRTTEFTTWVSMRQRCANPNNHAFKDYGARGITIDAHWATFDQFLKDMGKKPSPEHSLDRIDNNGHYEPSNCRWATHTTQTNNSRKNVRVEFMGKTQTLGAWARETGIKRSTLWMRLFKYGWSPQRALQS